MAVGRGWGWVIAGAAALGVAGGLARAEEPAPAGTQGEGAPAVDLDRLLRLPSGSDYGVERKGGLTRGEWRARFARIETALESERKGLEAAQADQDKIAGSADQWLLGPPGTTNTDAPLDYRLRQEITRHKDEIERLEKARKDLAVEANLAGVPDDWRK